MNDLNTRLHQTPVAIVGMGAVFPKARNLREFWSNIVNKVDCITDVPETHWSADDYYDPDPTAPDKTYCKRGGFLPDIEFDPLEFGLPPNIMEVTDVSQMLSLVVAKAALLDAGYLDAGAEIRDRTGIVLGVGGGQKLIVPLSSRLQYPVWKRTLLASGISEADADVIIDRLKSAYIPWEENSFPGMLGNVIAGRIANRFDLGGINCVTDAACASSMSALRLAIDELTSGRADMMMTGGVDTDNSIVMFMNFSKTPAFTRGDLPRPFDAESDGMMVGEGIGMMVLKRLEDAKRDGDKIYAVIRGLGASSDGRFKSIYAPRGEGQEKALYRAYDDAGISPTTVGMFEAHGTGTVAGDAAEVTTVIRFMKNHNDTTPHIALGSVKSQIGHAKAAAGIAGLIKTALALHHKVLPPTINVTKPSPKFDFDNSAFYINTESRPWLRNEDTPRRAGVSSFGFGGTNFHVVMEEYAPENQTSYRLNQTAHSLLLSAADAQALASLASQTLNALRGADSDRAFLNLIETSQAAPPPTHARIGFVAETATEAAALLEATVNQLNAQPAAEEWTHPKGIFFRRTALNLQGRVAALFAGQGSQYLNMGRELALNFPEVRESFKALDDILSRDGQPTLSSVAYPQPAFTDEDRRAQEERLQSTAYAQPAIGALSAGMFRIFSRAGFTANFTAGHSFGELSALWAAGVLNDRDYYELVKARGAAMAPPAHASSFDAGTMLAVTGDAEAIRAEISSISGVQIANYNAPAQVVLAGSTAAVKQAEAHLKSKNYRVVPLSVSAAFHTALVGHAREPFAQKIMQTQFNNARVPVYSNSSAKPYPTDSNAARALLSDHITNPVLFKDQIEAMYADGAYLFVEFGPRAVLTNLVKDILGNRPHIVVALNPSKQKDSDRQMREAFVQLQVIGLPLVNLDPYAVLPQPPAEKKKMAVMLNGAAYVSPKTRDAHTAKLNDGFRVSGTGAPQIVEKIVEVEKVVEKIVEKPVPVPANGAASQPVPAAPVSMSAVADNLDRALSEFRDHQRESQRVQELYLQNQAEYLRIFADMTARMASITDPRIAEQVTQSLMRFHDLHAEMLHQHDQYMRDQTSVSHELLRLLRDQYASLGTVRYEAPQANGHTTYAEKPAPVAQAPAPAAPPPPPAPVVAAAPPPPMPAPAVQAPPAPVAAQPVQPVPVAPVAAPQSNGGGIDIDAISAAMLSIVSDKTGYPSDMLDLGMDMEADLGIDSIKRVEILGALRDQFPNLPQFSPDELAELRTLGDIVNYMHQVGGGSASTPASAPAPVAQAPAAPVAAQPVQPAPVAQTPAAPAAPAAAPQSNGGGIDINAISAAMLNIVSDKTGYPSDMLDLGMDMEADLGIDSIKRVEILGALRDQFPNLPQFSPDELAELRTLGDIVNYMHQVGGGSASTPASAPAPVAQAPAAPVAAQPVQPAPVAQTPAAPAAPAAAPQSNGGGIDINAISAAMLNIVSDKTGYPSDMLDLGMDMEADLGIDSIKRVEILGALRDQFPKLPQFSPDELAELRTLGDIVNYMHQVGGAAQEVAASSPFDLAGGAVRRPAGMDYGIDRSVAELMRLPMPDALLYAPPQGALLIHDGDAALAAALADALTARGWRAVILSRNGNGSGRIALNGSSDESVRAAVEAAASAHGGIAGLIFTSAQSDTLFSAAEKESVQIAFLLAKHLKPHLTTPASTRRVFMTVTRLDGALGLGHSGRYGSISGGLHGLAKTLNLEWNGQVFCRTVDIDPAAATAHAAALIVSELYDPNQRLVEVAHGPHGRVTIAARLTDGVS